MSAPEIPNLKSLLANRRGGSSRGRGRGGGPPGASHESSATTRDVAIQGTDQDAAGSRVSCVELGYLDDPYAKLFATSSTIRRLPLLNRGSYVRTAALDLLADKFLAISPSSPKQIISLGAGTDTRYFRILDKYPNVQLTYHEIDFSSNTASKIASIQKNAALHTKLQPTQIQSGTTYLSPTYNIHALDLRNLAPTTSNPSTLPNLRPDIPTLLLSECCLIYLDVQTTSTILSTFLTTLIPSPTPIALIIYEPIRPYDAFGRTMISNLASRNIHLPTLKTFSSLTRQRMRLKKEGFTDGTKAADVEFLWRYWISEEEKERVAGLEMLDELEELELLLKHYCIAWGWRDGFGDGVEDGVFGRAWGDLKEQEGDDEVGMEFR